jgi:hypothetical protein
MRRIKNQVCTCNHPDVLHWPVVLMSNPGDAPVFINFQGALFGQQAFNAVQCHPTDNSVWQSDQRHVKPEITAARFNGLKTMSGGFESCNLPTPKPGILIFGNNKRQPDSRGGENLTP